MPDGPESIGEVARLIRQLEQHIDRRFQALEQRNDKLVSAEVHDRDRQHADRRFDDLVNALSDERQTRAQAIAHEELERKTASAANAARMDRIEARWKWLIAAVLVPVVLTVFNVLRDMGG